MTPKNEPALDFFKYSRELEAKATSGPWKVNDYCNQVLNEGGFEIAKLSTKSAAYGKTTCGSNAEYIVHARNNFIPVLGLLERALMCLDFCQGSTVTTMGLRQAAYDTERDIRAKLNALLPGSGE